MIVKNRTQLIAYAFFVLVILLTVKVLHDQDVDERNKHQREVTQEIIKQDKRVASVLFETQLQECERGNDILRAAQEQSGAQGITLDYSEFIVPCEKVIVKPDNLSDLVP